MMDEFLSTSAGPNTPELRHSQYSIGSGPNCDILERLEVLERRLEKAERMLSIGEELGKLKQDLDEIRQAEWLRRLEDLEDRIGKIESNHSSYLISLEARVESNSLKLESLAVPCLNEEIIKLKQDLQTQLFSVCLTLEEVASIAHRTQLRQQDLESVFSTPKSPPRKQMIRSPLEAYSRHKKPESGESLEDEEYFLKAISTQCDKLRCRNNREICHFLSSLGHLASLCEAGLLEGIEGHFILAAQLMEVDPKIVVTCMSALSGEVIAYPITSLITRAQAVTFFPSNLNRPFSIFAGCPSVLAIIPGFLLRAQLFKVVYPDLVEKKKLSSAQAFCMLSTVSDVLSSVLRAPFENYRHRMQTGEYSSLSQTATEYAGHKGPFGMWRGLTLLISRDVVFNLMRYGFLTALQNDYEKRKLRARKKARYNSANDRSYLSVSKEQQALNDYKAYTWINIYATIPAAILTTPLDFLKTRVMTHPLVAPEMSALGHLKKLHSDESLWRLFRGAGLRAAYVSIVMSACTSFSMLLMRPIERTREVEKMLEKSGRKDIDS